ncbi:hypothetical protein NXX53_06765 [Bacteroides salyersiae]|nr:hypothetical protein [Bacteroides salyersiae]
MHRTTSAAIRYAPNRVIAVRTACTLPDATRLELLKNKGSGSIEQSRIKKTKYFFEHRAMFMHLLIHEIKQAIQKAAAESKELAVRLNCTSDINLEEFVFDGKNILQPVPANTVLRLHQSSGTPAADEEVRKL